MTQRSLRRRPRGQDDINPFDDETEARPGKIRQPADVVDADEPDEEPVAVAAKPTKSKTAAAQATNGPDLDSERPVDDGFKEDEEDSAEPDDPVAAARETPPSGWHNQPSKTAPLRRYARIPCDRAGPSKRRSTRLPRTKPEQTRAVARRKDQPGPSAAGKLLACAGDCRSAFGGRR